MQFFSLVSRKLSASAGTRNITNQKPSLTGRSRLAAVGYAVTAGVATLGLASSAQAQTACNGGATLTGSYGLYVNGDQARSTNLKALTGTVVFDGKCGLTAKVTVNENGVLGAAFAPTTGSYTTNTDSTFTINLAIPGTSQTETYVASYLPASHELLGNEIDGIAYATINLKALTSVPSKTPPSFSQANLNGTYLVSGVYNDVVTIVLDGIGGLTATDRTSVNPQGLPATGTYLMYGTDGSFGGSFTVGGATYYYGAVLDNDANEFQMVLNSGPNGGWIPLESLAGKRMTPPETATVCAVDYGTCTVPVNTQATVWYGAGNVWQVFPARYGSFRCLNDTFGVRDFLNGVQKSCKIVTY